jgi:hypothetical protein
MPDEHGETIEEEVQRHLLELSLFVRNLELGRPMHFPPEIQEEARRALERMGRTDA